MPAELSAREPDSDGGALDVAECRTRASGITGDDLRVRPRNREHGVRHDLTRTAPMPFDVGDEPLARIPDDNVRIGRIRFQHYRRADRGDAPSRVDERRNRQDEERQRTETRRAHALTLPLERSRSQIPKSIAVIG